MLDLFLKLIDKLTALLKERDTANRRLFEDHIEPIYQNVQTIVDDYRQVLSSVTQQLEDPNIHLDAVIKELKNRRKKYERIRIELEKYSAALHKSRPEGKVGQFTYACYHLLESEPTAKSKRMMMTPLTSLLDDLEEFNHTDFPKADIVHIAAMYSQEVDWNWRQIAQCYFDLRTECLK